MKIRCVKECNIRLQPGERSIELGDELDDPSLVQLLTGHPCFELIGDEEPLPDYPTEPAESEEV